MKIQENRHVLLRKLDTHLLTKNLLSLKISKHTYKTKPTKILSTNPAPQKVQNRLLHLKAFKIPKNLGFPVQTTKHQINLKKDNQLIFPTPKLNLKISPNITNKSTFNNNKIYKALLNLQTKK